MVTRGAELRFLEKLYEAPQDGSNTRKRLLQVADQLQCNEQFKKTFVESGSTESLVQFMKDSKDECIRDTAAYVLSCASECCSVTKVQLMKISTFLFMNSVLERKIASKTKQATVYLIFTLTSLNSRAQYLAEASGCLKSLMSLLDDALLGVKKKPPTSGFRNLDMISADDVALIQNVAGAVCCCVNNPVHRENQELIVHSHAVKLVLEHLEVLCVHIPHLAISLLKLLSSIISDNHVCKDVVQSCGAVNTLMKALIRCGCNIPVCERMADVVVHLANVLDACISDHEVNAATAGECGIIEVLLDLAKEMNSADDLLRLLLPLAHCLELSESNREIFCKHGGNFSVTKMLSESANREVDSVIKYILQSSCSKGDWTTVLKNLDGMLEAASTPAKSGKGGLVSCSTKTDPQNYPRASTDNSESLLCAANSDSQKSSTVIGGIQALLKQMQANGREESRKSSPFFKLSNQAMVSPATASCQREPLRSGQDTPSKLPLITQWKTNVRTTKAEGHGSIVLSQSSHKDVVHSQYITDSHHTLGSCHRQEQEQASGAASSAPALPASSRQKSVITTMPADTSDELPHLKNRTTTRHGKWNREEVQRLSNYNLHVVEVYSPTEHGFTKEKMCVILDSVACTQLSRKK